MVLQAAAGYQRAGQARLRKVQAGQKRGGRRMSVDWNFVTTIVIGMLAYDVIKGLIQAAWAEFMAWRIAG